MTYLLVANTGMLSSPDYLNGESSEIEMRCVTANEPLIEQSQTNAHRSRRRYKRVVATGITSIISKLVVLANTIICVPLTYHYLGADRYGLWMAIMSLVLFLGFADFGFGNGLASALAEADGRQDRRFAHQQISCAFYLLLGIAGCLLLGLGLAYNFVPWTRLFHTQTMAANAEAGPASAVLIICAALNMPLATVLRVQIGYQEGYLGDLWNTLGNLLALFAVLMAVNMGAGLPWLVAGLAGTPLLTTAANFLLQFKVRTPELAPNFRLIEAQSVIRLAKTGFLFFVQQCFGLIYFVSDNLVIAQTLDSSHVAQFSVMQRIFSLGLVSQYFVAPLWPAFGEALECCDFSWARKTLRYALTGNLAIGGACAVLLLYASRSLSLRWTGTDPGPTDMLRTGLAVWVVLVGYVAAMNAFLNQKGVMTRHLICFGTAAVSSLALKIWLVRFFSLAGVVWATLIGFGVLYVGPALYLALKDLRQRERLLGKKSEYFAGAPAELGVS